MAAVASNFAPTVTVKVYKNGNRNFLGKTLVINRRHIRTMDALYDEVTAHIAAFNAVRKICTPIGGRPIQSLENIQNKSVYVAAGREEFKKLNYADLGISKRRPPRKTNNSPKKMVIVTEGRHKMDYEWGKRELKIIHVFCNGDVFRPSVKIVLQKRLQQSMEQILNIVQEHVFVAAAIAALYTIDGKLLLAPSQLVSGQNYVAVERGKFFKRANYGGAASSLSRSPRAPFLPQIGNGQLTNKEGRLPKKNNSKRKPRVHLAKTNVENKSNELLPRDQLKTVKTESVESPRDIVSNLSPDLTTFTRGLRVSQDNFTISASPPTQLENETPVQEYAGLKEEDNKEDSLTVGNVFKASGLLQEKAAEVKDTHQTKEEKPIDLLPAEEVLEEVLEQVEDLRKSSGDKDQDTEGRHEENEDFEDIETVEDNSKLNQAKDNKEKPQIQAWQHEDLESRAAAESSKETELNSRLSPNDKRQEPSTSSNVDDATHVEAPSEEEKKQDDGSRRETSSPEKAASPAAREKDEDTPPSSEPEKSDEEDSEDSEEDDDDDDDEEEKQENQNESDNPANESESNNVDKNSAADKGSNDAQNSDKTSYIS